MALTPEQEYALLALLDEPLVTLNELPKATGVNKDDLFLTRQDTEEKAVTGEVLKDYIAAPATLDRRGTVQLSNDVESNREDRAATLKAVKQATKERLPISGGILTGGLTVPFLRIQRNSAFRNIFFYNAENRNDAGIEVDGNGSIYLFTKKETNSTTGQALLKPDGYFQLRGNTNILPIGIPQPWPTQTPPPGWFKCNGAAFDKTLYPVLAQAYPSGVLPDLRGNVIRGWDNGRGIDENRILLTEQDSSFNHFHNIGYHNNNNGGAWNSTNTPASVNPIPKTVNGYSTSWNGSGGGGTFTGGWMKSGLQIITSAEIIEGEAVMRNIAFLYIVRAA